MVQDSRQRTKVFLDTYITAANLTKDDTSTLANYLTAFGTPEYPLSLVFDRDELDIDLVYSIGEPTSEPLLDSDQVPYGYEEHVPVTIMTVDKVGVTGTKLKWKGETELRRVCETYPTGSQRGLEKRGDTDMLVGKTMIYQTEWIMSYRRDTT